MRHPMGPLGREWWLVGDHRARARQSLARRIRGARMQPQRGKGVAVGGVEQRAVWERGEVGRSAQEQL